MTWCSLSQQITNLEKIVLWAVLRLGVWKFRNKFWPLEIVTCQNFSWLRDLRDTSLPWVLCLSYLLSSFPKAKYLPLNSLSRLCIGLPGVEQLLFLYVASLPTWPCAPYFLPIPSIQPESRRDTSWWMLESEVFPPLLSAVFSVSTCSLVFFFVFLSFFLYCILPLL